MKTSGFIFSASTLLGAMLFISACSPKPKAENTNPAKADSVNHFIASMPFGKSMDGKEVTLYTLTNGKGVSISAMNYGAIITSIRTPDKNGIFEDIVLGYDSLNQYEKSSPYFGAVVGRFGNRIAKGEFTLEGKKFTLAKNDGANHLHGGKIGFDKVFWELEGMEDKEGPSLKLKYVSKDGEEGYPGTLTVHVTYTLTADNELKIDYQATTDKATVLNITQHTYFNLSGNTKRDILDHELVIAADKFLPVDKGLIPTGELKPVAKTPFDFTSAVVIGARINDRNAQLITGKGYDHCWVLADHSTGMKNGGSAYDPASGRVLEFSTTEPAVQFYSGNFLDGTLTGKFNVVYKYRYGFCLETQHYPDSPNQKAFPSVVLNPGSVFNSSTIYKFSVR